METTQRPSSVTAQAEATGRSVDDWLTIWLESQLLLRVGSRSIDVDRVTRDGWAAAVAPLRSPLTLVTGWNPKGIPAPLATNRAANHRLLARLHAEGRGWCHAMGRARDGTWSEPGFAVGRLSDEEAAGLGAAFDQLAVYVVDASEVTVLASDRSFRRSRPRGSS